MGRKYGLFINGLCNSYDELCKCIVSARKDLNNHELKIEVNRYLGTCLHWLMNAWERVDKTQVDDGHIAYMDLFRYANNALKHDTLLVELHDRVGGFSFPMTWPMIIPEISYVWVGLELNNKRFIKQFIITKNPSKGKTYFLLWVVQRK